MAGTRYDSALLYTNKRTRLELSPVVVRFNAKVLSQNLQHSKESFMRRLKENPYLTHYREMSMFRREGREKSPKDSFNKELPKTERVSSILRLMKRN